MLDYVLALARRGELEILLFVAASNDDEITDEAVEEAIGEINDHWKRAREQAVFPQTNMPTYSPETVALGKKAFLTEEAGCFKCHAEDGCGRTTENVQGFKDVWGFQTRAADLTAGMFHGGQEPVDIYRRIYSGINGTPMPSFQMKLAQQPDRSSVSLVAMYSNSTLRAQPGPAVEQQSTNGRIVTRASREVGGPLCPLRQADRWGGSTPCVDARKERQIAAASIRST